MDIESECIRAYRRHKHLRNAAKEVGIPWQTLYVHLRRSGEPVTGDKRRYGSSKDRLAAKAEQIFSGLVPGAIDQNRRCFQSKVDFYVGDFSIDVKAARPRKGEKRYHSRRWAFSVKKQEAIADFFVCFCLMDDLSVKQTLLIPGEIARNYMTISVPETGGKWSDYAVATDQLNEFFQQIAA